MASTQPRAAWSILSQKAEKQVETRRNQFVSAQSQLSQLQASRTRIETMIDEYQREQDSAQQKAHDLRDTFNARQFLAQLKTLMHRVAADEQRAKKQLLSARQELVAAEQEASKMQKLVERDIELQRTQRNLQEQRQLDDIAIQRYQWRTK